MRVIDLHCHTMATKKGDGLGRNATPEVFKEKIEAAGVEIVAITNHNAFDQEQYKTLRDTVHGIADVWPGVELDVVGSAGKWHTVVVVDPNNAKELAEIVTGLALGRSPNDCSWSFQEVWTAFEPVDALMISHCHDKEPAIPFEEISAIRKIAGSREWELFFEPRTLMTLGIWSNHGFNMMMGSDVKDWQVYEKSEFVSLRLDVDSFSQLCLLAQRDHGIVETLLNRTVPQEMVAKPHQSVSIRLPIYQDINVIFGQKGTGKSEILSSLVQGYQALGITTSVYRGGEKYEEFKRLLSTDAMDRNPKRFGRGEHVEELASVTGFSDATPTLVDSYVQWAATRGNSEKKDAFHISESRNIPPVGMDGYSVAKSDETVVSQFSSRVESDHLDAYLTEEDGLTLLELLGRLAGAISIEKTTRFIDSLSTTMANKSIATIKGLIDKKSNTVSIPGETGFLQFAYARIQLLKDVTTLVESLSPAEDRQREYLGRLEDKGRLTLVSRWRYLTADSKAAEYGTGKIQNLKKWKKALDDVSDSALKEDLPEKLAALCEVTEAAGITSLGDFIGVDRFVTLEGSEDPYDPSDGEKGIVVLERKMRDDASVYLLDEPELGMSNLYIDSVIRPLLEQRARESRTVIVATHNANLAVRTLPYLSVYREHVKGSEFRTYIGNPFTNELRDLEGAVPSINWSDCSMRTLEGGREAFYRRKDIYEAGE